MSAEGRLDNRYFASVGMTYKLNRDIWLKTEVRQDWLQFELQRRLLPVRHRCSPACACSAEASSSASRR